MIFSAIVCNTLSIATVTVHRVSQSQPARFIISLFIINTGGFIMKRVHLFAIVMLVCLLAQSTAGLDNGLARTPPMGWNSWNKFGCDVSEKLIKEMADALVSSGMKDAGYQYIVIDDCWQIDRDAQGNIIADPKRFPSGMKALADYIHAKGLKFGLYSDAGTLTCQKRPGSPSSSASASGVRRSPGCGRAMSATCGARPATFKTAGTASATGAAWASFTSSTCKMGWKLTQAQATGTTRTCSKSATAA